MAQAFSRTTELGTVNLKLQPYIVRQLKDLGLKYNSVKKTVCGYFKRREKQGPGLR